MNKRILLIAGVSLLIIAILGGSAWYIYSDIRKANEIAVVETEDEPVIEIVKDDSAATTSKPTIQPPSVRRPVTYPSSFTEKQKSEFALKIAELQGNLEANWNDFNSWIDIGLMWKAVGDYEGARLAWEYGSAIRPQNSISFDNLGVLYGYYLKNPAKSEANFKKAVSNDPKMIYLYGRLYDFYTEVLKDPAKAKAAIELGLKNNPNDPALKQFYEQTYGNQ